MSYDPKVVAGKQPDGTQGIATVEFQNGDTVIKTLVGCIVHIRPMDKSLRNILKIENGNENVEYFVYVPWFQSCRPSQLSESTILQIRLHRYRKPTDPKGFEVSKFEFDKYKDDQYFVIPCKDDNFKNSSFLKEWSSELLLYNNPSQLPANKVFYGFKKETQNLHNILYKFQEFEISDNGGVVGQTVFSELEEQGVLQVHQEEKRYVIGCYKKEGDNQIKMFSFLFKGLTEIEFGMPNPSEPNPPTAGTDGSGCSSVPNPPDPSVPIPPTTRTDGSGGSSLPYSPTGEADIGSNKELFIYFLHEFAKDVSTDWKFLGRYLHVNNDFIEAIDYEYKSTEEKAIQMFLKWQKLEGKKATPERLVEVLRKKLKNVYLAEKVEKWMESGQTNL